ncbi:hypothetical protein GCM10015535_51660 [Streptomyces gelaticus]|uniref:Uncharacterized protein n=1 Tax=Streptomyces gelaticus TaxID=285446 RepID=A0ABQ2W526_9ACTN|nr:hypothetical protein GCM10015535_51660 [Streptomyces gelaticus]
MQERPGEAVALKAAGGALEADVGLVLRPDEQIGHGRADRTGQITGGGVSHGLVRRRGDRLTGHHLPEDPTRAPVP